MEDILDDQQITKSQSRRRDLLPTWIKIFLWLFLIFSLFVPYIVVIGIMGGEAGLGIYGLETTQPFSITGIFVLAILLFKGIVAFGLWTEKDWAVQWALLDGFIGIISCITIKLLIPIIFTIKGFNFGLPLEVIALVPYFLKMHDIKSEWAKSAVH